MNMAWRTSEPARRSRPGERRGRRSPKGVAAGQAGAFFGMYLTFMIKARILVRGLDGNDPAERVVPADRADDHHGTA